MPLVSLRSLALSYGAPSLFEELNLDIDPGERICLVGRNGTGKSTLLKIIAGEIEPDDGECRFVDGVQVARMAQEAPSDVPGSVFDLVAGGLGTLGDLVADYHRLSHRLAEGSTQADLEQLSRIQERLEAEGGWELEQRTERVVSRLSLDGDANYASLSGGQRRRVMLARALLTEPDLLLLDEPTNHLDIPSIEWLEEFLLGFRGSLLLITHDRRFLRRLATRIIELERGRLTDWPGDYDNYCRRREERLNAEAKEQARFDKRLAEEEVWIRQGIKARRTRNEGRVRALEGMREERLARLEQQGKARLRLEEAERSGKLVVEAEGVNYAWDERPLIHDLNTLILRGDRVGIVGPNGAGKSTLLKLLLGQLQPDSGRIRLGTKLEIAYFDQQRAQLDPDASVRDNLALGSDQISIGGRSKHVLSYLKDFLFTPDRAHQPVSALSGGERNRLLLARLFSQPANLLVLDEPTNDLDAETLELLEELLLDFKGTLLLVSHDRDLLDRVVTSSLVLEGEGRVGDYVGGYSDWLRQRPAESAQALPLGKSAPSVEAGAGGEKVLAGASSAESRPGQVPGGLQGESGSAGNLASGKSHRAAQDEPSKPRAQSAKIKLSYKDQRDLEQLPQRIEAQEAEVEALHQRLADPRLYQQAGADVVAIQERLAEVEQALARDYARWEALENQSNGG